MRASRGGVAMLVLAVAGGACTASPTERGYKGQSGLGSADGGGDSSDSGGPACAVTPTASRPSRTAGCGKSPGQALAQYVERPLAIACAADNARERLYYVRLPANYDPNIAYRTVYLAPGCGPPPWPSNC